MIAPIRNALDWASAKPRSLLTQRAYLNALSAFVDYGSRIAVSLVVTPILVAGLGSVGFGIWKVLQRAVGYVAAADGRPSQALKWVVANRQNEDEFQARRKAIGQAIGVWILMIPLLAAIGAAVVWIAPHVTSTPEELSAHVRIAAALLVANLAIAGLASIPGSVLRGMNLGYKRMGIVAALNLVSAVLTIGAVKMNMGLIGIAVALLMQSVLTFIFFLRLAKSVFSWFGAEWPKMRDVVGFARLSIWYSAWDLVEKLLIASDVIILAWVLSASAVTNYVLTGYVSQTLVGVVVIMIGAAAPGMGTAMRSRDPGRSQDLYTESVCLIMLFGTVLGAMVLLWNKTFIILWVGADYYAGHLVNMLLVLIAVELLLIRNGTYVLDLALKPRAKVAWGTVSSILSILLALLLTHTLGIAGICIATLLGRLSFLVAVWVKVAETLKSSIGALIGPIVRPFVSMVVIWMMAAYSSRLITPNGWGWFLLLALISCFGIGLIALVVGFSSDQRVRFIKRIQALRPLSFGV